MVKRATEGTQRLTPVVLGFVVKKRYVDSSGKEREKEVSRRFTSRSAADVFRSIAEMSCLPVDGQTNVVFYTTEDNGLDDIPEGV